MFRYATYCYSKLCSNYRYATRINYAPCIYYTYVYLYVQWEEFSSAQIDSTEQINNTQRDYPLLIQLTTN